MRRLPCSTAATQGPQPLISCQPPLTHTDTTSDIHPLLAYDLPAGHWCTVFVLLHLQCSTASPLWRHCLPSHFSKLRFLSFSSFGSSVQLQNPSTDKWCLAPLSTVHAGLLQDALLVSLIQRLGTKNWSVIARGIHGRTGKSCRLRCAFLLRPTIRRCQSVCTLQSCPLCACALGFLLTKL